VAEVVVGKIQVFGVEEHRAQIMFEVAFVDLIIVADERCDIAVTLGMIAHTVPLWF
jgi:hypothetical protein